ncbi:MAG TPA: MerR family transcriptional regulator [Dehalococcoidia bacterium]|nr:MerR family transcriptional regulator [Dehalococcoidia bacterium]
MALVRGGVRYYHTTEAAQRAGISRSTLLRWLRQGRVPLPARRDRNGWRLFTQEDLEQLKTVAEHAEEETD